MSDSIKNRTDTRIAFSGMPIAITITVFLLIFLCSTVYPQTVGETQLGVQEIEISLNRSRDDTVIVVGPQVAFKFPESSQRIAILWRAWPGIGHVAEQDVSVTDERCVLRIHPKYSS